MTERGIESDSQMVEGNLPLTQYQYFHFLDNLPSEQLGDGVVEFVGGGENILVLFDVSLATAVYGRANGRGGNVLVNESSVAQALKDYSGKSFSGGLSVEERAKQFAEFLRKKPFGYIPCDLGLSVTVCEKKNGGLTIASFGSNSVFGPGKALIRPGKSYDPHSMRETRSITRNLAIRTVELSEGDPVVIATDGFSIPGGFPGARTLARLARGRYSTEELKNPDFLKGEAFVVRVI